MHALMASFALFPTVFQTYEKRYTDIFTQKKLSKDSFNSEICYRHNLLVTGPCVVNFQKVNKLAISNGPHALHLSNFEITCAITP